jgi:hypothetical protein
MTEILDHVVLDSLGAWLWILATLAAIVLLPRLFGLPTLNALIYAQMTLAFNAVTIVAGYSTDRLDAGRSLHFFLVEFAFLALTCEAYRRVLKNRERAAAALTLFFAGRGGVWLMGFMTLVGVFNFAIVPTDGDSRIAYMTAGWFSILKPFLQLATPLAYIGVLVMLGLPARRRLGFILLAVTLAANVLTGSKASFLFNIVTALLALRDLSMQGRLPLRGADRWKLVLLTLPLALYALLRLEVSPADVADRFLLFGEATILTYFAPDPTEACQAVSPLAAMHRGVARALGDASANDIDTLFGFALTKLYLGVNTFTGPNGRLSAYMICNFPGAAISLGWFMVMIYFGLLGLLFKQVLGRPMHLALVYPYIVSSFGLASQDFNLIMADITLAVLLLLSTVPLHRPRTKHALG